MLASTVFFVGSALAQAIVIFWDILEIPFFFSLSFLGVGVQPPEPSWGNILNLVTKYWDEWWLGVFPGAAVFLTVLSYNLVGEGLRDATDPRLRG